MESAMKKVDAPVWFSSYENIRADSYAMLASLLVQPPSEDLRNILQSLQWDDAIPARLDRALIKLRQASHDYPPAVLEVEFNRLFVGMGSGEVVPYASWYKERRIQSKPLASLRSDLIRLGIVRQAECHESEDHAGALCEIMAIISDKSNDVPYDTQARFFEQHIALWMMPFFKDLQSAKSAKFYRVVGSLGGRFLECEREYLKYGANAQFPAKEGGSQNESGIYR